MICPCYERLISAGDICPGENVYSVVFAPGHKTLSFGDRVVMREDSGMTNLFVRINDFTVHDLRMDTGYVLVVKEINAA
jgi:hypothetical protein